MATVVFAYAVAIFALGGLGSLGGALIQLGAISRLGSPALWGLLGGLCGAVITYWLGARFFDWMGVHFGWYTYALSMLPVVLNDGRRAARDGPAAIGVESSHARGTLIGIILSLISHFL